MSISVPSHNTAVAPDPAEGLVSKNDRASPASAVHIAAFGCKGLDGLSPTLGFPVSIVAAVPDPDKHLRRLGDVRYASGVPMARDECSDPFDFHPFDCRLWRRMPIDVRWFGKRSHPLDASVHAGSPLLPFPTAIDTDRFATTFRRGPADLRFEAVARRPAPCVRRHGSGRSIAVRSRNAPASVADPTPVEVSDLVAFHPRTLRRVADVALAAMAGLTAPGHA